MNTVRPFRSWSVFEHGKKISMPVGRCVMCSTLTATNSDRRMALAKPANFNFSLLLRVTAARLEVAVGQAAQDIRAPL
jgi:hypothetical protein